ncbi:MAG TPA: flavin reductase family protein [Candidatus Stackebrandtia excrementipullorum]|nr:flavin reductase family protein [Candidatus Stackebrandtia excrementipullorum]
MTFPPDTTTAERFRNVMRDVPAAVTVVTTRTDNAPHGATVSAFMSLSMDPPMLLVSLDNRSTLLTRLTMGSVAGVNILATDQSEIATFFATRGRDHSSVVWEPDDGGPPRLPGCLAWVTFTVDRLTTVGDHTLVIGEVRSAETASGDPLLYLRRGYGSFDHR